MNDKIMIFSNQKKADDFIEKNITPKRYRWHCIYDRIKDIPNPIGAEIGVFRGECSGHLLEMHPGLKLYMIDMWSPDTYKGKGDDAATEPYRRLYEKECDDNFKKACAVADKYKMSADILKGSSLDAAKWFDDEILDFVFIDGAHDEKSVKTDIIAWLPKVKKGGWLIMHDYDNPSFPGVKQAVNEFFGGVSFIDSDYIAAVRV